MPTWFLQVSIVVLLVVALAAGLPKKDKSLRHLHGSDRAAKEHLSGANRQRFSIGTSRYSKNWEIVDVQLLVPEQIRSAVDSFHQI